MSIKHPNVPVPDNIKLLPLTDKGYFKPWFVKADDFRVVDGKKARLAIEKQACWICGQPFEEQRFALVASPVSALTLISREPPCHVACAEYAMQICPFILYPKSKRRGAGLEEEQTMAFRNRERTVKNAPENPQQYYLVIVDDFTFDFDSKTIRCKESNVLERQYWIEGIRQSDYPRPILPFQELPEDLQRQLLNRTHWTFSDVVPRPPKHQ